MICYNQNRESSVCDQSGVWVCFTAFHVNCVMGNFFFFSRNQNFDFFFLKSRFETFELHLLYIYF